MAKLGLRFGISTLPLLGCLWAGAAFGQAAGLPAPSATIVDRNNVDLLSGQTQEPTQTLSIGGSGSGMTRGAIQFSDRYTDGYTTTLYEGSVGAVFVDGNWVDQPGLIAHYKGKDYTFPYSGGVYTGQGGQFPSAMSCTNAYGSHAGTCTFTDSDGVQYIFDMSKTTSGSPGYFNLADSGFLLANVVKADGEVLTYGYSFQQFPGSTNYASSLQSISSSLGWMIKYTVPGTDMKPSRVMLLNTAVDYCNPTATSCSGLTRNWQNIDIQNEFPTGPGLFYFGPATKTYALTNFAGNTTTITVNYNITDNGDEGVFSKTITSPSGVTRTYAYNTNQVFDDFSAFEYQKVQSFTIGGLSWDYLYQPANYYPGGPAEDLTMVYSRSESVMRKIGHTGTSLQYIIDEKQRRTVYWMFDEYTPDKVINPEATFVGGTYQGEPLTDYVNYGRDANTNITEIRKVAKAGSGLSDLVSTATYPSCSNLKLCHKPLTVTDENGVTVTYTYDAASGNVLTATWPAVNGVQAQTRYSYSQITPHIKNAAGNLVAQPAVWRLTGTSSCMTLTLATCVGTTDEVKTTITYTSTNVQPATNTTSRGDGSLPQTTTYQYDDNGNVSVEDGPKPGSVDAIYYFYDSMNREIGDIDVDPDGTGPRPRAATRTTYDVDGRIAATEAGTTTGTTSGDLVAMTPVSKSTTEFSSTTGLPVFAKNYVYQGGVYVLKTVTQTSYDSRLRVDCVAERLNPAVFSALPASACTLGTTGPDGPDRITKYTYDTTDAVTKITRGYGTAVASDEVTNTYNTVNGELSAVTDAKGNTTNYEYDGFHRRIRTRFLNSSTDYTQVGYTGSRMTSSRLRDGQTINFSYDAAGRVSASSGANPESLAYNNFGQVLSHTQNGHTSTFTFNSLGWLLSEATDTAGGKTVSYGYDNYGKRQQLTYPDGFYVTYGYDDGDEVTAINENGSTTVITYDYDNLGHVWHLNRANGQNTTYTYNADLLLGSLSQVGNTTSYTYGVDNKLKTASMTNSAFQLTTPVIVSTSYTANSLNQMSSIAGQGITYDGRGNLAASTNASFTYSAQNLLTSATLSGVATTAAYDAQNRLMSVTKNGATTKFVYDGTELIAEYDGNNTLLRRYVHGIGNDQPLIWYEIGGTNPKYYLYADERGSVVATADGAGSVLNINQYDEYGLRLSTAPAYAGRFAYTGQSWLSEVGMYYYKARMYHPTIGRFMQTDPVGYADGINWYAYVHNDPINGTDPLGLADQPGCIEGMAPRSAIPGYDQGPPVVCKGSASTTVADITDVIVRGNRPNIDTYRPMGFSASVSTYLSDYGNASIIRTNFGDDLKRAVFGTPAENAQKRARLEAERNERRARRARRRGYMMNHMKKNPYEVGGLVIAGAGCGFGVLVTGGLIATSGFTLGMSTLGAVGTYGVTATACAATAATYGHMQEEANQESGEPNAGVFN